MNPSIEIGVFGTTTVRLGGKPVELGGKAPRALLGALAAAGHEGASMDALIEALWGDEPPRTARKSVQKHVSEIRKKLAPQLIETTTTGYRIPAGRAVIDAEQLRSGLEEAVQLLANGSPEASLASAERALEIVAKGHPLADLPGTGFAQPLVAQYTELAGQAPLRRIDALLAAGRNGEAVAGAEALISTEPLREETWAQLMLGLYRTGRQSEALRAYRRLRALLGEELGIEPSMKLRSLEEQILLQDPALIVEHRAPVRLPAAFTSFVGRQQELADLAALLDAARLLTITGPGGSGKTRLAIEAAGIPSERHLAEVFFVDLAPVGEPRQIPAAIATAVGIVREPDKTITETLVAHLSGRRILLVIDNCEHLRGDVAALVLTVLHGSAETRVLATSREPLGLTGEVVFTLKPLTIPPDHVPGSAEVLEYSSVRLFADRAAAARPGFDLGEEPGTVLDDIVAVCRLLEGIPLAIELAARQLWTLEPAEIRSGLLHRLDRLAAPGEPVERHRTLEAAIEWSYKLADADSQRLFLALSVFPGSFSSAAAIRIWELLDGAGDVETMLDGLVASSMVTKERSDETSRYRLLEPIRAFGAARAADEFAAGELERVHATWLLGLFAAGGEIIGPEERTTLRTLKAEDHHLPVALAWATRADPELALRITVASGPYLRMVSYRFAWSGELKEAIEAGDDAVESLRAHARAHAAQLLAENLADHETASPYARQALNFARAHEDPQLEVVALVALATSSRNEGRLDTAAQLLEDAIDRASKLQMAAWTTRAERWLAFTEIQRGNYQKASEMVAVAENDATAMGSDWMLGKTLWLAAAVQALEGDYAAAAESAARSFELLDGFDDPASPVHVRAAQGDAARLSGDALRAGAIYEECLRGFQDVGDQRCTASTLRNLGMVKIQLGDAAGARPYLIAALQRRHGFGDEAGVAECIEGLALVAEMDGAHEAAITLFAAGEVLRSRSGSRAPQPERDAIESAGNSARTAAGTAAAKRAKQRGIDLGNGNDLLDRILGLM